MKPQILPIWPILYLIWPHIPFKRVLQGTLGSNGFYDEWQAGRLFVASSATSPARPGRPGCRLGGLAGPCLLSTCMYQSTYKRCVCTHTCTCIRLYIYTYVYMSIYMVAPPIDPDFLASTTYSGRIPSASHEKSSLWVQGYITSCSHTRGRAPLNVHAAPKPLEHLGGSFKSFKKVSNLKLNLKSKIED